jgi:hypothetical protein
MVKSRIESPVRNPRWRWKERIEIYMIEGNKHNETTMDTKHKEENYRRKN